VRPKRFKAKKLKVRIRGRDDAPLSMPDMRQGLFELARRLGECRGYRVKAAAIYLTVVDEHGDEVQIGKSAEWSIFPYECAADRMEPPGL
jgi:hypothetical protein